MARQPPVLFHRNRVVFEAWEMVVLLVEFGVGRVLATELGVGVEIVVGDRLLDRQAVCARESIAGVRRRLFGRQVDGGVGMAVSMSTSSC